jgi:hypothetical protein
MPTPSRVDARLHAWQLARACAALGARTRTIRELTGLTRHEQRNLLFTESHPPPRGRTPDTREWYHTANLLHRIEASVFAANFSWLYRKGFAPADALVSAYRYYRSVYAQSLHISFDRAFDLAAHLEGLWITRTPSFALVHCKRCDHEFLDALGAANDPGRHCLFCQLIERYRHDPRLTAAFRTSPPPFDSTHWAWPPLPPQEPQPPDADSGTE